jgi:hypothetical protein
MPSGIKDTKYKVNAMLKFKTLEQLAFNPIR